jgi:aminoglycoside phosphotransferase (APT) family kinase protein
LSGGFTQTHTQAWLDFFTKNGYADAQPLAAGVEGAIYRLGGGTVAKVWARRQAPELARMQAFYADVASGGLPFATPEILRIEEVDGVAVTFDRELYGKPLQQRLAVDDPDAAPEAIDCLVEVLHALRTVSGTDSMRQLSVLEEQSPLWEGASDFPHALISLIERRIHRFGGLLRAQVVDFDHKYDQLADKLVALDQPEQTVIHGDLFCENILVDDSVKPTAVLDFGFISTAGDPRMDASVSAVIYNMYGPHRERITRTLTDRFCIDLGYPAEVLLLYRAAYAMATSNFLTSDGSDGHFEWCVWWLNHPEVTAALDV